MQNDLALFSDDKLASWIEHLSERGIPFERNSSLKSYTSFRIGGEAALLIKPRQPADCAFVQSLLASIPMPFFFLGGGSNILISDKPYRGLALYYDAGEEIQVLMQTEKSLKVKIPASARAPLAGKKVSAMGYTGMEFLTTIPGYIGGAVIQNAGCYGQELVDITGSIDVVAGGEQKTIPVEDAGFAYRHSRFKNEPNTWIMAVTLELGAGNMIEIQNRIEDYKNRRINSQPKNRRSAGSIFKNPPNEISPLKAWQLIEQAGLRGTVIGDAEISSEHCNFIVNRKNATSENVYQLIQLAEKKVFENTGIKLEREVILFGEF